MTFSDIAVNIELKLEEFLSNLRDDLIRQYPDKDIKFLEKLVDEKLEEASCWAWSDYY